MTYHRICSKLSNYISSRFWFRVVMSDTISAKTKTIVVCPFVLFLLSIILYVLLDIVKSQPLSLNVTDNEAMQLLYEYTRQTNS
jgi:hypothetical protein